MPFCTAEAVPPKSGQSDHDHTESMREPTLDMMPIRIATQEDLDAVFALNKISFPEAWSYQAIVEAMEQGYEIRVWNTVDGYMCAYMISQDILDEIHVLQLAVQPEHHRQGFASRLTKHLLEEKQKSGAKLVFLEARVSNKAAHAMYKRMGFRVIGKRKAYYVPRAGSRAREDAVLMTYFLRGK